MKKMYLMSILLQSLLQTIQCTHVICTFSELSDLGFIIPCIMAA